MLAHLGRHEEAIDCFQAVLAVEPAHANALLQLARSYRSLKQYDKAAASLTRLHELAPERVDVLVELGNALRLKGDLAAGVTLLQRALALAPEDTELMY
ncbi:tetratricopeptide repeat protein, partial [Halobellus sp. Atlit-31R]